MPIALCSLCCLGILPNYYRQRHYSYQLPDACHCPVWCDTRPVNLGLSVWAYV